MARRALLATVVLLLVTHSTARKNQKKKSHHLPPSAPAGAHASTGAGLASVFPAGMRSTTRPELVSGPIVRHLFSTPLYVADISASVDVAALADLALGEHRTNPHHNLISRAV